MQTDLNKLRERDLRERATAVYTAFFNDAIKKGFSVARADCIAIQKSQATLRRQGFFIYAKY